jgi:hypothetical protein
VTLAEPDCAVDVCVKFGGATARVSAAARRNFGVCCTFVHLISCDL